jgi:hypothetical protein
MPHAFGDAQLVTWCLSRRKTSSSRVRHISANPVGLQRPQIRADFRKEESMGFNPAPPAFAILVGYILLWYIPLAADLDRWEASRSCSPRFSLDRRSVKLLLQRFTLTADSQERF